MARIRLIRSVGFLPREGRSSGPLIYVLAVMMFMCTITLAGAFAIFNATETWTGEAQNDFTVQVVADSDKERNRQVSIVLEVLGDTPGVSNANRLDDTATAALLEPWIGAGNLTSDLPIPALIAARVEPGMVLDFAALQARLGQLAPGARVDDHERWLGDVIQVATAIEVTAAIAVLLIVLASAAIVVFGSRARLAAYWDIIEIVHLMGARDTVIRDEFRQYFLEYGLRAGIYGLVGAAFVVVPVLYLAGRADAGLISMLNLSILQIVILAVVPVGVAVLAMATAGFSVHRVLKTHL